MKCKPISVDIAAALCLPPSFLELACHYCNKCQPLNATTEQGIRKCLRCHDALYCSRECQRAHWKQGHKSLCSPKVVELKTDLNAHPTMDQLDSVYEAYRADGCGPSYRIADPLPVFRRVLNLAKRDSGGLPKWWNKQKSKVVEQHATNKDN